MDTCLRVGVIGLGRLWRTRYRPALLALPERFEVGAVCDEIQHRAGREARRLGCRDAPGPTALLEGGDVHAVLLLDPQWYRLWPLELACRFGKPVFCACPLELDDAHADSLVRQVRDSGLAVMVATAPRWTAAAARLRELLESRLGPARLVLCRNVRPRHVGGPAGAGQESPAEEPGLGLLDWCTSLMGGEPLGVTATGGQVPGFGSLCLEFAEGRAVQITSCRAAGAGEPVRLEVAAERGWAVAQLPDRVRWAGGDGRHSHVLHGRPPAARLLLEHFHDAVLRGEPPRPNLEDAHRLLRWLRAARRSRAEGRRIDLTVEQG